MQRWIAASCFVGVVAHGCVLQQHFAAGNRQQCQAERCGRHHRAVEILAFEDALRTCKTWLEHPAVNEQQHGPDEADHQQHRADVAEQAWPQRGQDGAPGKRMYQLPASAGNAVTDDEIPLPVMQRRRGGARQCTGNAQHIGLRIRWRGAQQQVVVRVNDQRRLVRILTGEQRRECLRWIGRDEHRKQRAFRNGALHQPDRHATGHRVGCGWQPPRCNRVEQAAGVGRCTGIPQIGCNPLDQARGTGVTHRQRGRLVGHRAHADEVVVGAEEVAGGHQRLRIGSGLVADVIGHAQVRRVVLNRLLRGGVGQDQHRREAAVALKHQPAIAARELCHQRRVGRLPRCPGVFLLLHADAHGAFAHRERALQCGPLHHEIGIALADVVLHLRMDDHCRDRGKYQRGHHAAGIQQQALATAKQLERALLATGGFQRVR
ncbi:hypothetical protein D3C81_901360 [compost metagenome]